MRANSLILAAGLALAPAAEAATIVDTGGNANGAQYSFYQNGNSGQYFAGLFGVKDATSINAVSAFMRLNTSGTVTAKLFADNNFKVGKELFSQDFKVAAITPASWYGASDLNWSVGAGKYWLSFVPTAAVSGAWLGNAPKPLEEYAQYTNGVLVDRGVNGWDQLRVGIRVEGGAVPEPTTWALMILGFGAVGYSLRRRAKVRFATI